MKIAASRNVRMLFAQAAGTAALAGLLFGFDTAVTSGVTQPLATYFALLLNTLIAIGFQWALAHLSPAAPFGLFAGMMVVQLIVVALFFPETRGVSLDDMHRRPETA